MQSKVKEIFNKIYWIEQQEESLSKVKELKHKKQTAWSVTKSSVFFDVAHVTDLTHFIDCNIDKTKCPMQWEDLQIDYTSIDKRYCEYCDKDVYRAENEFMVEKLQNENKCMSVSSTLLEKINGKISDEQYINLQNRLKLSKLFLLYKYYSPDEYKKFLDKKLSEEEILKEIILDVLKYFSHYIAWFEKNNIDIEFIFDKVVSEINDVEFQKILFEKLNKIYQSGDNKFLNK